MGATQSEYRGNGGDASRLGRAIGRDDLENRIRAFDTLESGTAGEKHRSAALQQSEQGTRERLFRRWRARRNSNRPSPSRRSESDQPHEWNAIQKRDRAQPAPDRAAIRCGACGGRKCSALQQSRTRNAQLVDARTDRHLWGQTYDRDLVDVFAIQSEIAKTIADQLQAKLSPSEKNAIERPPTTDISAFDLYARAKSEKADDFKVVDLLTQAVARDPSFFDAYFELAKAHGWLYFLGVDHTSARLALAEASLHAASRLRPAAGETHLARV